VITSHQAGRVGIWCSGANLNKRKGRHSELLAQEYSVASLRSLYLCKREEFDNSSVSASAFANLSIAGYSSRVARHEVAKVAEAGGDVEDIKSLFPVEGVHLLHTRSFLACSQDLGPGRQSTHPLPGLAH
jgi:hypothetical protein